MTGRRTGVVAVLDQVRGLARTRPGDRPRLLVLSTVLPFPRSSGQQQRVYYTLKAAASAFHVTFGTVAGVYDEPTIRRELANLCDDVLLLPQQTVSRIGRIWHRAASMVYALRTGLKRSNYYVGRLHLSPRRVEALVGDAVFDCVLYEYWHAAASANVFRHRNIPSILDMHDILWRSYSQQLGRLSLVPERWKQWTIERYKRAEERAWQNFDALVAINREEEQYVSARLPRSAKVFHAAMGTDLALWPYSYDPALPSRLAYYGGLGSVHNQADAITCATQIMPMVWKRFPDVELWLVGSDPPQSLRSLAAADRRIHVSGYVKQTQSLLKTMTGVLCPWSGRFGFRSRLIEVMALGVPTVASPDAVVGMELADGQGLLIGDTAGAMAAHAERLVGDAAFAREQSRLARQQVERRFSVEDTYGRFVRELEAWLHDRAGRRRFVRDAQV